MLGLYENTGLKNDVRNPELFFFKSPDHPWILKLYPQGGRSLCQLLLLSRGHPWILEIGGK